MSVARIGVIMGDAMLVEAVLPEGGEAGYLLSALSVTRPPAHASEPLLRFDGGRWRLRIDPGWSAKLSIADVMGHRGRYEESSLTAIGTAVGGGWREYEMNIGDRAKVDGLGGHALTLLIHIDESDCEAIVLLNLLPPDRLTASW